MGGMSGWGGVLDGLEEEREGEEVRTAAGREVIPAEPVVEESERVRSGGGGDSARSENGRSAGLSGAQPGEAAPVQEAGVVEPSDDRAEGIQSCRRLARTDGLTRAQRREREGCVRKCRPRFTDGAGHAVVTAHPRTGRTRVGGEAVREPGDGRRTVEDPRAARGRVCGGGRTDEAESPDGAAVGVDAVGGIEHPLLTLTTERGEAFTQRLVEHTVAPGAGHCCEGVAQGFRRADHGAHVHVVVGAAAAQVDETWLGGQRGLRDERVDGQVSQVGQMYRADRVDGAGPVGSESTPEQRAQLRRDGILALPEDLGVRRSDASRSLLAAKSIEDLVTWSGGLYDPPANFRSW